MSRLIRMRAWLSAQEVRRARNALQEARAWQRMVSLERECQHNAPILCVGCLRPTAGVDVPSCACVVSRWVTRNVRATHGRQRLTARLGFHGPTVGHVARGRSLPRAICICALVLRRKSGRTQKHTAPSPWAILSLKFGLSPRGDYRGALGRV